jgi:hypothetical protein
MGGLNVAEGRECAYNALSIGFKHDDSSRCWTWDEKRRSKRSGKTGILTFGMMFYSAADENQRRIKIEV